MASFIRSTSAGSRSSLTIGAEHYRWFRIDEWDFTFCSICSIVLNISSFCLSKDAIWSDLHVAYSKDWLAIRVASWVSNRWIVQSAFIAVLSSILVYLYLAVSKVTPKSSRYPTIFRLTSGSLRVSITGTFVTSMSLTNWLWNSPSSWNTTSMSSKRRIFYEITGYWSLSTLAIALSHQEAYILRKAFVSWDQRRMQSWCWECLSAALGQMTRYPREWNAWSRRRFACSEERLSGLRDCAHPLRS